MDTLPTSPVLSSGRSNDARQPTANLGTLFDSRTFEPRETAAVLTAKERRSLARRLHDDLGQTMFVLRMEVDHLSDLYAQRASQSLVQRSLDAVRGSMDDA